jgi:hypothetical protein
MAESGTTRVITINIGQIIIIVIALIVLIGGGWMLYSNKVGNLKDKLENETKLKNALVDSISFTTNAYNEIVAEKLTLQGKVKDLTDKNNNLSSNEKNLLARVKKAEKENTVITAALIETHVIIDSLSNPKVTVDSLHNTVNFKDSTNYLKFNIDVKNVTALKGTVKPAIMFNQFDLINTQFVDFFWKDNRKEGFPVAFSVSNSNPYFKTFDISSYAIPQLDKVTVKPNFIQRVGISIGKNKMLIITPTALVGGYFIGRALK